MFHFFLKKPIRGNKDLTVGVLAPLCEAKGWVSGLQNPELWTLDSRL